LVAELSLRTKKKFDTQNGKQQILPKLSVRAENLFPAQQASRKNLL
jgi:hypothetical protein